MSPASTEERKQLLWLYLLAAAVAIGVVAAVGGVLTFVLSRNHMRRRKIEGLLLVRTEYLIMMLHCVTLDQIYVSCWTLESFQKLFLLIWAAKCQSEGCGQWSHWHTVGKMCLTA